MVLANRIKLHFHAHKSQVTNVYLCNSFFKAWKRLCFLHKCVKEIPHPLLILSNKSRNNFARKSAWFKIGGSFYGVNKSKKKGRKRLQSVFIWRFICSTQTDVENRVNVENAWCTLFTDKTITHSLQKSTVAPRFTVHSDLLDSFEMKKLVSREAWL